MAARRGRAGSESSFTDDDSSDFDAEAGGGGGDERMRDMLAMYYGMGAAPIPEGEEAPEEGADGTPGGKEGPRVAASPAAPVLRIDDAQFDALGHVRQLLLGAGLQTLLERDDEMVHDIKMLDGELQMLVYENYSKFIAATDTIRRMKTNVAGMDTKMGALSQDMAEVSSAAEKVQEAVRPSLSKVDELVQVQRLLERLSFLLSLPQELKAAIATGQEARAIAVYRNTSSILLKHRHLSSFGALRVESVALMRDLKTRLAERLAASQGSFRDQIVTCHLLFRLGGLAPTPGVVAEPMVANIPVSEEYAKMVGLDLSSDAEAALRPRLGLWAYALDALDLQFTNNLQALEAQLLELAGDGDPGPQPIELEGFSPRLSQFLKDLASAARAAMRCFASALNEASQAAGPAEEGGDEDEENEGLSPPPPEVADDQLDAARTALVACCTRLLDGYVPVLNRFLLLVLAADGAPLGRLVDGYDATMRRLEGAETTASGSHNPFADMGDDDGSVTPSEDGSESDASVTRIPRVGEVESRPSISAESELGPSDDDPDSGFDDGMEARYDGAATLSTFLDQLSLLPSALPELHSERRTQEVLQLAVRARLSTAFERLGQECREALESLARVTAHQANREDKMPVEEALERVEASVVGGMEDLLRRLQPLLRVAQDALDRPVKLAPALGDAPDEDASPLSLPDMLSRCIWALSFRIADDAMHLGGISYPVPLALLFDGVGVGNMRAPEKWIDVALASHTPGTTHPSPTKTLSPSWQYSPTASAQPLPIPELSPPDPDALGAILALRRAMAVLRTTLPGAVEEGLGRVFGPAVVRPLVRSAKSNVRLGIRQREETFEDDMGNIVPQTPLEILSATFAGTGARLSQRWCEAAAASTLEKSGFRRSLKVRATCKPHQLKGVRLATTTLVQDLLTNVTEASRMLRDAPRGGPASIEDLRIEPRGVTLHDAYSNRYRSETAGPEASLQTDVDLELAMIERRLVQGGRRVPPMSVEEAGEGLGGLATAAAQLVLRGAMETVRSVPEFSPAGFQQLHLDATFLRCCAPLLVATGEEAAQRALGPLLEDLVMAAADRAAAGGGLPAPLEGPVLLSKCNEARTELARSF